MGERDEQSWVDIRAVEIMVGKKHSTIYKWIKVGGKEEVPDFPRGRLFGRNRKWWRPDVLAWCLLMRESDEPGTGNEAKEKSTSNPRASVMTESTRLRDVGHANVLIRPRKFPFVVSDQVGSLERFLRERASRGEMTTLQQACDHVLLRSWEVEDGAVFERLLEEVSVKSHADKGVLLGLTVTTGQTPELRPTQRQIALAVQLKVDVSTPELLRGEIERVMMGFEAPESPLFLSVRTKVWEWDVNESTIGGGPVVPVFRRQLLF